MPNHQKQPLPLTEAHQYFSGSSAKSHCPGAAGEEAEILQQKPLRVQPCPPRTLHTVRPPHSTAVECLPRTEL